MISISLILSICHDAYHPDDAVVAPWLPGHVPGFHPLTLSDDKHRAKWQRPEYFILPISPLCPEPSVLAPAVGAGYAMASLIAKSLPHGGRAKAVPEAAVMRFGAG